MISIEVKGIGNLVKNLQKVKGNIGRGVQKGLLKAGHHLMRESLKIVPVQLGNLKGSWFVEKEGSGLQTHVIIGYSGPEYAAYVHEIPNPPIAHGRDFNVKHATEIVEAKGTWRGTAAGGMFLRKPEEQFKYLEHPIRDNADKVLKIIREAVMKTK
jgi:hypothetical protein